MMDLEVLAGLSYLSRGRKSVLVEYPDCCKLFSLIFMPGNKLGKNEKCARPSHCYDTAKFVQMLSDKKE